jgi:hypothetical protein
MMKYNKNLKKNKQLRNSNRIKLLWSRRSSKKRERTLKRISKKQMKSLKKTFKPPKQKRKPMINSIATLHLIDSHSLKLPRKP